MNLKTNYGMVVSGHKEATKSGIKILKKGGNAMDAAIAASATLAVAIPNMSGLGGDSIALWYDAKKNKISVINGSGRSPSKATRKYFTSKGLKKIPQRGPLSISVPGLVHSWEISSKKYGKKKLKILLKDSIVLAKKGIKVDKYFKSFLESEIYRSLIKKNKYLSNIYGDRKKIKINSIIKQNKLSETITEIANKGAKAFYNGKISKTLLEEVKKQGSILSEDDFKKHRTLIQKPISTNYLGKKIFTAPPNSQGLALIYLCEYFKKHKQFLKKIDIYDYIKNKKKAFKIRDLYCVDPQIYKIKNKFTETLNQNNYQQKINGDTSTLVTVDKMGNAVCWVQSLFEEFGSGIVSPTTGIVLHNRLYLEKITGKYKNLLRPNKRPFHTLCPSIVLNNNKLDLVISTPGDHGQSQTIFQIINFIYKQKYNIQNAINLPRIRHNNGNQILVEKGFKKNFTNIKKVKLKIYKNKDRIFGGVTAIKINKNGTLSKGADKRRFCY
tara:strand:+ start:129 stop:1619 length:1491 start_codon:yes stop_codon:yes gene_type:complete